MADEEQRARGGNWESGGGDAPTGYVAPGVTWPNDLEENAVLRLLVFNLRKRIWHFVGVVMVVFFAPALVWIYILSTSTPSFLMLGLVVAAAFASKSKRVWGITIRLIPDHAWIDLMLAGVGPRDVATGLTAFVFSRPMCRIKQALAGLQCGLILGVMVWLEHAGFGKPGGLSDWIFVLGISGFMLRGVFLAVDGQIGRWWDGEGRLGGRWASLLPFYREAQKVESPSIIRERAIVEAESEPPWVLEDASVRTEPLRNHKPRDRYSHFQGRFTGTLGDISRRANFEWFHFTIVVAGAWGTKYWIPALAYVVMGIGAEAILASRRRGPLHARTYEWGNPVELNATIAAEVRQVWDRIPKTEGYKRAVQSRGDR